MNHSELPFDRSARRLFAVAAFLPFLVAIFGCGAEVSGGGERVLRFAAIPDANTSELQAKFEPLAQYLSDQLGIRCEYVPVASYDASVEAFRHGDIQLAWFGGLTGVQARDAVEGARAIAQGEVDPKFKSYFIANASVGLERSEAFPHGLAGHTFTFGSARSTSGRLMPEHAIRSATGKTPEEFFGHAPGFSGAHDKTAELVESGAFDAGAISYAKYDQLVADGVIDPERCKIVWVTPEYSDYNWTVHPVASEWFGADFESRLQRALLELQDEQLLAACLRRRFIAASNEDFEDVRRLAIQLDFVR